MKVNDKLEFLEKSKDYSVRLDREEYIIEPHNSSLVATINIKTTKVNYYVDGVYNSGCDYAEIDIDELDKLKRFVELLLNDKKEVK